MQEINIDGKSFNLYTLDGNTSVMENLEESRTYNGGVDYFLGSDCITINAFHIPKANVSSAITAIEDFFTKIYQETESDEHYYMESFSDFSIFHKPIENSTHDVFFTHFDGNDIQYGSDELYESFEHLFAKLKELSTVHIVAGADIDDSSLDWIALGFFATHEKELCKDISIKYNKNFNEVEWTGNLYDMSTSELDDIDSNDLKKFFLDFLPHIPDEFNLGVNYLILADVVKHLNSNK